MTTDLSRMFSSMETTSLQNII